MAPGTPFTDVDKPLHLHITPGACSSEVLGTALCALHTLRLRCRVTIGDMLVELRVPLLGSSLGPCTFPACACSFNN